MALPVLMPQFPHLKKGKWVTMASSGGGSRAKLETSPIPCLSTHLLCEVTMPTAPLILADSTWHFSGDIQRHQPLPPHQLPEIPASIPNPKEGNRCHGPQGALGTQAPYSKMWPTIPDPGGEDGSPSLFPALYSLQNAAPPPCPWR